ncbi:MAG: hypothetical protein K9H84_05175 [Bacteroidales bacterium]|nr:hypothetical protein [Bacteroidales bacterium]
MKYKVSILVFIIIFLSGCQSSRDLGVDVSDINVDFEIKRYGQAIFNLDYESLDRERLKSMHSDFSFFINQNPDSNDVVALQQYLQDPVNRELYKELEEKYSDLSKLEAEFDLMFRHLKYYFPSFKVPDVYTYVSSLNFKQPVLYPDSLLIVGLDMYLGKDMKYYDRAGIPKYLSRWFVEERIVPESCEAIISKRIRRKEDPSLLDYIVEQGKFYYLMNAMMPDKEKNIIIRYTDSQMEWIQENEIFVWGLIVEKELLFTKDRPKIKSFIDDGPFTSSISRKAPPRIADWIGWQMVEKYMDNNKEISMMDLLQQDNSMEILKKSNYKPAQKSKD